MCMSPPQTITPPADHNTVNPFVIVPKAAEFIDFVTEVFDGRESTTFRVPDRDGSLIHAEVVVGDSSILIADRKPDWPFTPALLQVYVPDSQPVLDRAAARDATVITPVSAFYGGYSLARFRDPWNNLWWLYAPDAADPDARSSESSKTDWQNSEPSHIYTTLMQAMRELRAPEAD